MKQSLRHNASIEYDDKKIIFSEGISAIYYMPLIALCVPCAIYLIYKILSLDLTASVILLCACIFCISIAGYYNRVTLDYSTRLITVQWTVFHLLRFTRMKMSFAPEHIYLLEQEVEIWMDKRCTGEIEMEYYMMNKGKSICRIYAKDTYEDLKQYLKPNGTSPVKTDFVRIQRHISSIST